MSVLALPAPAPAHEPPEARGAGRDDVALLVASRTSGELVDSRFGQLARFLRAGDLLVINTSATLPAALPARLDGQAVELRLSTPVRALPGRWVVELRMDDGSPLTAPPLGARIALPGGRHATLLARHLGSERLSVAELCLGAPVADYLRRHGRPIRYAHVPEPWPLEAYQTVFALDAGSAEMPSAGRPFTTGLVTELVTRGVRFAPITLHAGVSSLGRGEAPLPEPYRVTPDTARLVNATRSWGGRVIAIGTTAVRALETVAADDGTVRAGEGDTGLMITPERGLRVIDGVLTGWHEADSSHLLLLEAVAGAELLERAYRAAVERGHLGHEFGDACLIVP